MTSGARPWQTAELATFLVDARGKGYAGSGKKETLAHIRRYHYQSDHWAYEDRYSGNIRDGGMECVTFDSVPVWVMVYYGGLLDEDINREPIYRFLRQALMDPPPEMPCRGPNLLAQGSLEYSCNTNGSLGDFSGTEHIKIDNLQVYYRRFMGGFIVDSPRGAFAG